MCSFRFHGALPPRSRDSPNDCALSAQLPALQPPGTVPLTTEPGTPGGPAGPTSPCGEMTDISPEGSPATSALPPLLRGPSTSTGAPCAAPPRTALTLVSLLPRHSESRGGDRRLVVAPRPVLHLPVLSPPPSALERPLPMVQGAPGAGRRVRRTTSRDCSRGVSAAGPRFAHGQRHRGSIREGTGTNAVRPPPASTGEEA